MEPFFLSRDRCLRLLFIALLFLIVFSCNDDDETPGPEVVSITPASGRADALVAISGRFFHHVFSENKVKFNGKDALVANASTTQLNVIVPLDAESGPVTVTVNGMTAVNQPVFTVEAIPTTLSAISPTIGRRGTEVTIMGSNFLTPASANVVTINGIPAVVNSATATSITVTVPERAGSGVFVVNGVTCATEFSYTPDIFLGGYENIDVSTNVAKLWKNGKPTTLSRPGERGFCEDILIVNDDIHSVGYSNNGVNFTAQYWKNNLEVPLAVGTNNSWAKDIIVVGNDVYIAGHNVNASGIIVARYWKNGEAVDLGDGKRHSFATGIAVNGGSVYVAGYVVDGTGQPTARYWKDGVAFPLISGTHYTDAWAITVVGNDVYVAGSDWGTAGDAKACYWKNGTFIPLSEGEIVSYAAAIAVDGNDVYVAGAEFNKASRTVAKYWKNGEPTILADGGNSSSARAIDVIGHDVYVGGFEQSAGGMSIAKYWKNGVPVIVSDGGNHASISALVVR